MLLQGNCLSNVWTIKVTFEALHLAAAVPVQTGAGIDPPKREAYISGCTCQD